MIEDEANASLVRERQEVLVAMELVASGGATRVVVAGLAHARELVVRLGARATAGGVLLRSLPADAPRAVIVLPRPALVR